ncbi:MAG: hypothetical protein Q7T47_01285 [Anaerolineales bacterium]|nr:hypothetical protein [Anaerolineales bacterium]
MTSSQINCGMSGSAVLDAERNLVVGIVSETWFPDLSTKDRDTAWAVNARVLRLKPLGLPLQDASLPLRAAPAPKTDTSRPLWLLLALPRNTPGTTPRSLWRNGLAATTCSSNSPKIGIIRRNMSPA